MRITKKVRGKFGEKCRQIWGRGALICCGCADEVYLDIAVFGRGLLDRLLAWRAT